MDFLLQLCAVVVLNPGNVAGNDCMRGDVNWMRTELFFRLATLALGFGAVWFLFFGINFILCLYPGFQLPLLYVSVAIIAGIWMQRRSTGEWCSRQGLALFGAGLATLVLSLIPFLQTVLETLRIVAQTSYPGVYRNTGGGLRVFDLFSGVLGFFESENRPPFGYPNICEASNFYPLWIAVLPVLVVAKWRKRVAIPWLMITLATAIILLSIYCIIPMPAWAGSRKFPRTYY